MTRLIVDTSLLIYIYQLTNNYYVLEIHTIFQVFLENMWRATR